MDKLRMEALLSQWNSWVEKKKEVQQNIDSIRKEIEILMGDQQRLSIAGFKITKFRQLSDTLMKKTKEMITVVQIRKVKGK